MQKTPSRGRSKKKKNVLTITLLGLLLLVAFGLTWKFAFPDSWSSVFAKEQKKTEHPGMIAVLVSPQPLTAFTAVDATSFINPQTGDFYVSWVLEKVAQDAKLIRDPALVQGRVLRNDKAAFKAFTEADFYPRGTQASLTGALEPGQRAVNLNASEIDGLRALKRFDRFDLYAVKAKSGSPQAPTGYMDPDALEAAQSGREWSTDRMVIAQNAQILVPAPEGKNAKNPDSVSVAMTSDEATHYADAKARGAKILCMARSGRPGGDTGTFEEPVEAPRVEPIKVFTGDKSSTTYVPVSKPQDSPSTSPDTPHK